ncbi:MAG: molecular chaperone DnaJ [Nannocystaceae bacterium]|nr:J domain-containing protein [bacterium]
MATDHYAVLGVERKADADEIKRAYRRLTLQFHPDRHPDDPAAQERFRQINQAYDVLGDPRKRARYDTQSRLGSGLDLAGVQPGQSPRDLLQNVFGDVFRSRRRGRRRGRDLRYTLTISLEDAVRGGTHDIAFEALGPCETCEGSGTKPGGKPPTTCGVCGGRGEVKGDGLFAPWTRCGRCDGTGLLQADACKTCRGSGKHRRTRSFTVSLPPGVESGAQKVLEGQGEPGRFQGEAGDLKVTVRVRPDPFLERRGTELRCELFVSLTEAALGARVEVPTVDGPVEVEIPAGIRSGTKLRLRGKGIPAKQGRGDQIVQVSVETPRTGDPNLTATLRELEERGALASALPQRAAQRAAFADRKKA